MSDAKASSAGGKTTGGPKNSKGQGDQSRNATGRKSSAPATKQVSKIGPARVLNATWSEDSTLKGESFVLWLGGGKSAPQQFTFHRPIGVTKLEANQWVATPTGELGLLLERKKSEDLARWERRGEQAIQAAVLAKATGRKLAPDGKTPIWVHKDAPPIGATVQAAMAAAKAAGAKESEWVNHCDQAVRASELAYREALRTESLPKEWLGENPKPSFETRGGPLGDRPQVALAHLSGMSLAAAKDKVLRSLFGPPPS